jgi:hypothetical protein
MSKKPLATEAVSDEYAIKMNRKEERSRTVGTPEFPGC